MIICPNCAAENRAEAATCFFCGQVLASPTERANPTQPVRVQGSGSSPTASTPPPPPPPYDTQGMTYDSGAQRYPPADQTQPGGSPPSGSTQPYPPYQQETDPYAQTYPAQPGYGPQAQVYPPAPQKSGLERFWPLLIGSLIVVFLCAGAIVVWTFSALIGGGSTRLGQNVATQAAELLPLPDEATLTPADPTPWPTFTALPTFTLPPTEIPPTATLPPQPTATPAIILATATPPPPAQDPGAQQPTLDPTQVVDLEKLLSPECASALDELSDLGGQVTSNPTVPFDAQWRSGLNQALDNVNTNCGSLDDASPLPGVVNEARGELNQATESFDSAARLFNEGVREWNLGKVLDAGRKAREGTTHLNNAISALGKLR
jgi:hypothetical protein